MNLIERYPDHEVMRWTTLEGIPTAWNRLASGKDRVVVEVLGEILEFSSSSKTARVLNEVEEVGILIPRKRALRHDNRARKLAIQLSNGQVLLFYIPVKEYFQQLDQYPSAYVSLITKVGSIRFSEDSGRLLWPHLIPSATRALSGMGKNSNFVAFYDHESGDYDCWKDSEDFEIWTFQHELNSIVKYVDGGFKIWFEKRLLSAEPVS